MDGMIVDGRDHCFTTFQAQESSLVAERAAFPVKCCKRGFPNTGRISPVREGVATEIVSLNL